MDFRIGKGLDVWDDLPVFSTVCGKSAQEKSCDFDKKRFGFVLLPQKGTREFVQAVGLPQKRAAFLPRYTDDTSKTR